MFIGGVYALGAIGGFFLSQSVEFVTSKVSRSLLMVITGGMAAVGLFLSALVGEILWIVIGAFFIIRLSQAIRYPIYSQLKNDLIPSHIRATTLSLISVLDSALDLLIFGLLSTIAFNGINVILLASGLIAVIGTFKPTRKIKLPLFISKKNMSA